MSPYLQMNTPGAANPCSPGQFSSTHLPGGGSKRPSGDSEEMPQSPTGLGQPKRRGRPPSKFFKQVEQHYLTQLTAQPIPPGERVWLGWGKHGGNGSCHHGQCDSCGFHPLAHIHTLCTQRCALAGGGSEILRHWMSYSRHCIPEASGRRRFTNILASTRTSCRKFAYSP